jgi:hypothetical protein
MKYQYTLRRNARRTTLTCLFLSLLWMFAAVVSQAQTTQQFTGHVVDSTGAIIPMAEVVVHNQATGEDFNGTTTGQGDYTIPYLKPGIYSITVTKPGFKISKKTDITLSVDQTSSMNFTLTVGATSEVVTVVADQTQIELVKGDRGEIIDSERVNELPLDSRNPYLLFGLTAGTHDFSNTQYPRPFDNVTDNMYSNGAPQQPTLNLDGVTNTQGKNNLSGFGTNSGLVPSVDAVQEFKVVTGAADASYGRGGGSAMDVALKSGSNQFHGTLDYYKRGAWLDAYSYASKWNAAANGGKASKAPHNRDQFSLEFDGPVEIPHLFHGKNKLFFVLSYEEMLEKLPNTNYNYFSIPNPAWAKGNFSDAQYWNTTTNSLQPLTIYDPLSPLTEVVDPNDGKTKLSHSAFPGNIIPSDRIDPVGATILADLTSVTPNNKTLSGDAPFTNNWKTLQVESDTWRNGLVKVDYIIRDADRLSLRWAGQGRWSNTNSFTGWPDSADFNMNGKGNQPKSETGGLEWTHTFSPNLLLDVHATLMTSANDSNQGSVQQNSLKKLGFAAAFYNQVQNKNHFPMIWIDGPQAKNNIGPWGAPNSVMGWFGIGSSWHLHTIGLLPTLTWIHAQHTIRTGFDYQLQQASNPIGGSDDLFYFGSKFTNQYYQNSDAPGYSSGSGAASTVLGYPNGGGTGCSYCTQVVYNLHDFESQPYYAPWVQDDWKITKNLTLNLGFRWDFQVPRVLRNDKMNGMFNTSVINPVTSQLGFAVMGGTEFAGVNGQPHAAYALNKFDWQPRIGFAYAFRPTMSLRGFIAKNYVVDSSINGQAGFSTTTSYVDSIDNGLTPYTVSSGEGLANPYAAVNQPVGSSQGYLTNLGNSFTFMNPKYKIPSFWNYSLTYEVALSKHDVVTASYVGNLTPDGATDDNINHPSSAFYQQCNGEAVGFNAANPVRLACQNVSASNPVGSVVNPFQGVAAYAGSGYYSPQYISRADTTRPYYGWSDLIEKGLTNNTRAWYNSFQLTAKHQVSNNLSLYFNYAHSTAMSSGNYLDTTYRVISRQVSTSNQVKHAINFSGVAYLPFGRGRALLSSVNQWVDEAINGWEISPLLKYYSGFPWRPDGNNNWEINTSAPMGVSHTTLAANGSTNYERIKGVTPCVGWKDQDSGAVIPSPAAKAAGCTSIPYVQAAPYAVPRNVVDFGVTQPGATQFDMSIAKSFTLPVAPKIGFGENTKLQLRMDMLNALNHPNFDTGYDNSTGDANWGTISKTGSTNNPRYLQLSARLNW